MTVKNMMETMVWNKLNDLKETGQIEGCTCQRCLEDIAAITLNNVPPKYVATDEGELYLKAKYLNLQNMVDISCDIIKGMEIVRQHPRHSTPVEDAPTKE